VLLDGCHEHITSEENLYHAAINDDILAGVTDAAYHVLEVDNLSGYFYLLTRV